MLLLSILPAVLLACGDVCNEDDGAYVMSTFPNVAPEPTCSAGYKRFSRVGYNWCMRVIYFTPLDFTDAAALCTADGAVPSGYQTASEASWITTTAISLIKAAGYEAGGVWLGLHMTIGCAFPDFATDSTCGVNSFEFTDGYTTGTSQIGWGRSEPINPYTYECAIMAAYVYAQYNYSTTSSSDSYILPTQVENYDCSSTATGSFDYETMRTIVCGKPQTEYS